MSLFLEYSPTLAVDERIAIIRECQPGTSITTAKTLLDRLDAHAAHKRLAESDPNILSERQERRVRAREVSYEETRDTTGGPDRNLTQTEARLTLLSMGLSEEEVDFLRYVEEHGPVAAAKEYRIHRDTVDHRRRRLLARVRANGPHL